MADVKLLRVFVASPADVQAERDALGEIVKNINTTLAGVEPIQLRLVRWEDDVEPAVGGDAQSIVNAQIGNDYDVFVGILWKHFGTATPRAESGTIEEFERAVKYHSAHPNSVSVMFYFKTAPVPIDIDTEQLARVQNFKERFGGSGLYGTFGDTREFAATLQIRLTRLALRWCREGRAPDAEESSESAAIDTETDAEPDAGSADSSVVEDGAMSEDAGFLDLIEEGTAGFLQVTEVTERMSTLLERLGSKMKRHTEEATAARDSSGAVNVSDAKRAIDSAAASIDRFAGEFSPEIGVFKAAFARAIRAYGAAASLLGDFERDGRVEQLQEASATTRNLESTMGESQRLLRQFRENVSVMPRATTRFNRARRRVIEVLDTLDAEMTSARGATMETLGLFDELQERFGE
ncbi:MAG: hypothetical protein A49_01650 [Methyloceanibacter sp.]|nr:MAG: hypothetical protein A49_01650 [Methyloceanibacter sp.]